MLYQLSYSRITLRATILAALLHLRNRHGGEGDRTPDLVNAIHALSQLSYAPAVLRARCWGRADRQASPYLHACQPEPPAGHAAPAD